MTLVDSSALWYEQEYYFVLLPKERDSANHRSQYVFRPKSTPPPDVGRVSDTDTYMGWIVPLTTFVATYRNASALRR